MPTGLSLICTYMDSNRKYTFNPPNAYSATGPPILELTEDAILFPHGASIHYADIIRMSETKGRFAGLMIFSDKTKNKIPVSYLPTVESYQIVRDYICSKALVALPLPDFRNVSTYQWREFPEPMLRWKEQDVWSRYRTYLFTSKPLLPRLAKTFWVFTRCYGVILIPWIFFWLIQFHTLPTDGYFGLSLIALIFASLHWLYGAHPTRYTEISFRENGITLCVAMQTRDWNYRSFSGWTVIERQFKGDAIHVLLLQANSPVIAVAIPDTDTRDRATQILQDKKIPQAPDLKPSWEQNP